MSSPAGDVIQCFGRCGLIVLLLGCAGGCAYYRQAIGGQVEIFSKQKSNEEVILDSGTDPGLKQRLELIGELREFAETDLHLEAGENFTRYADLGREHVVWSVFATPEFSLEPKRWWYPVVGKLSYRGYFRENMAHEAAAKLRRDGYDVFVGGVDAYSTLGWFSDPVLSTFVEDPETHLAELIFHELTHRRLYIAGETAFNEAMATAVATEGVKRWLRSRGDEAALKDYGRSLARRRQVYRRIENARRQLETLYEDGSRFPAEELRRRKAEVFEQLGRDCARLRLSWGSEAPESKGLEQGMNNAHLNAIATYHELVPLFERLLDEHEGDMDSFFQAVERTGKELKAVE